MKRPDAVEPGFGRVHERRRAFSVGGARLNGAECHCARGGDVAPEQSFSNGELAVHGRDERLEVRADEVFGELVRVRGVQVVVEVGDGGWSRFVDPDLDGVGSDVGDGEVERVRGERDSGDAERVRLGEERRGDDVVVGLERGLGVANRGRGIRDQRVAADPVVAVACVRDQEIRDAPSDRVEHLIAHHAKTLRWHTHWLPWRTLPPAGRRSEPSRRRQYPGGTPCAENRRSAEVSMLCARRPASFADGMRSTAACPATDWWH